MLTVPAFLGLGTGEVLVILVLIFLFFGVDKLPQAARSLGRAKAEFDRAKARVMDEISLSDTKLTREQIETERSRERQIKQQLATESAAAPRALEEARIRAAARDLGIETEGRSLDEVKRAISERVSPPGSATAPKPAEAEEAPWPEDRDRSA